MTGNVGEQPLACPLQLNQENVTELIKQIEKINNIMVFTRFT